MRRPLFPFVARAPRAPRALLVAGALALTLALAPVACLSVDAVDFRPTVDAAPALDTTLDEADAADALDEADADAPLGCRECIERPDDPGPGCADEVKVCRDDAKCTIILDCIYATGCFYSKTRKDFIVCAIPCAAEAGVVTTSDPVVALGLGVATCADNKCRPYCGGGDAGS